MARTWVFGRTVIEEPDVTAQIQSLRQQFPRFEDAYNALTWSLSHRADRLGEHSIVRGVEYRLYRQDRDPVAQTPALIVVYTHTISEVTIIGIRAEL
jgi:hypothetical protein